MTNTPIHEGWSASLALEFAREGPATQLVRRQHAGPLVVQKALYPEGPELCQVVLVHPPGGIAGGDRLDIAIAARPGAQVQLLTPAATKWYRSAGRPALQSVGAMIEDGACLEWLPHESIAFDGADAQLHTRLSLRGSAVAVAWEIVALGRRASGESFTRGQVRQRIEVVRDDALTWVDQAVLTPGDRIMDSPLGLNGCSAFGSFLVCAPRVPETWLVLGRNAGSKIAERDRAITRLPGVLLARGRGHDAAAIRDWFESLWRVLRPVYAEREALTPRLWAT